MNEVKLDDEPSAFVLSICARIAANHVQDLLTKESNPEHRKFLMDALEPLLNYCTEKDRESEF